MIDKLSWYSVNFCHDRRIFQRFASFSRVHFFQRLLYPRWGLQVENFLNWKSFYGKYWMRRKTTQIMIKIDVCISFLNQMEKYSPKCAISFEAQKQHWRYFSTVFMPSHFSSLGCLLFIFWEHWYIEIFSKMDKINICRNMQNMLKNINICIHWIENRKVFTRMKSYNYIQ